MSMSILLSTAGLNDGQILVPMHIANLGSSMSYTIAYLGHTCSLHIAIATQSIFQPLAMAQSIVYAYNYCI